jgi:Uma2 family endonuclease
LSGPPDLVVEVLSESAAPVEGEIKPQPYVLHRVPDSWRRPFRASGNAEKRSKVAS